MKKLFAFLIKAPDFGVFIPHGYANGYVAVPPEHPCYGKHYDDVEVDVHGGLTFGKPASVLSELDIIEPINFDSIDQIPKDYFVFGFDTCHAWDGPHLDREWCINETMYLMKQLENIANE